MKRGCGGVPGKKKMKARTVEKVKLGGKEAKDQLGRWNLKRKETRTGAAKVANPNENQTKNDASNRRSKGLGSI